MNAQKKALDEAERVLLYLLEATEADDVETVGGEPLTYARKEAVKALPIIRAAIEAKAKPAPKRHAFVFISGGCVSGLTDERAYSAADYVHVIDWDNAENGVCAVCGNEVSGWDTRCATCGIVLEDDTQKNVITAYKNSHPGEFGQV